MTALKKFNMDKPIKGLKVNLGKLKDFATAHLKFVVAGAAVILVAVIALILFTGGKANNAVLADNATVTRTPVVSALSPGTAVSPEQSEEAAVSPEPSAETTVSPEPSASPKASPSPKPSPKPSEPAKPKAKKPKAPDLNKLVAAFEDKGGKYFGGYSSNHYKYTPAELKMLAVVIYREAKNQPYACKVAVGNVVMNRVLSPGYPGSTIKDVVTRKNQFAYKASVTPNAECMGVARDILDFEVWTVPQNTYFFRAISTKSNWGSHKYFTHYGNTAFYRDSYSGRTNRETIPPKLFARSFRWPQYGCKPGDRVHKIQIMLRGLKYKVSTDGFFGMDTKEALMKFQKSKKFKADGVAGPSTIKALIKQYGVDKYMKL